MERQTVALLFSNVASFSKLSEPQLRIYLEKILPEIAQLLEREHVPCIDINTWADSIVIASADPYRLAHFALDLRDFFRNRNWSNDLLPNLSLRIALHAGVVFTGDDPIRKTKSIIGTQTSLAARIEPITTPGEVWVTQAFVATIRNSEDTILTFDELGTHRLAKAFGDELLFRLRRHYENESIPPPVQEIDTRPSASDDKAGTVLECLRLFQSIMNQDSLNGVEALLRLAQEPRSNAWAQITIYRLMLRILLLKICKKRSIRVSDNEEMRKMLDKLKEQGFIDTEFENDLDFIRDYTSTSQSPLRRLPSKNIIEDVLAKAPDILKLLATKI